MDAQRWTHIGELFEAASARPAGTQDAFLRDACHGDDALYREVRALLDADGQTHDLLDRETLALGAWIDEMDAFEPIDGRIGAYHVVRLVGTGGMGRVYLGERADGQFDQQVALKVVKRGMDSEQILRRFASERQILARLQHPRIARLLDGGVTQDGRPFFAMEYVEGVPIDTYCDAHRLTIDERLRLFLTVCDAVRYAHQNLVVHRDLKPDNILVTSAGQVKLLDFGIAKLLEDDAEVLTRTGAPVMTPEYASPEQVRGELVSTASDVYTLGVILYELLTGHRPYTLAGKGAMEKARIVLDAQPTRPSLVLRQTEEAPPEAVSKARKTQPDRLRRRLTGDLDAVCLKALRKDPDDRYATVTELADEVERHLGGLPVRARRGTAPYRVRKFIDRHRAGVFVTASVVLFVVAFGLYHTTTLRHERDVARREATKAAQTADFLTGIFEMSEPGEAQGRDVTARELLDAGAARIRQDLAGQPLVRASLLETLGNVYRELSLFDEARPLLEESLALRLEHLGARDLETASSQTALAMNLQDVGDVEAAAPLFRDALATRRALLEKNDPDLSESLTALAYLHETNGDAEAAEPLFREALAVEERAFSAADPRVAMAQVRLAHLLRGQDRYDEAEELLRDALQKLRAHYDAPHPDVASTLRNLAAVLRDTERYGEADTLYQEALALRRALHGEDHAEVANTLNSYALLLQQMGDYDRAGAAMEEFVAILGRVYGSAHPSLAAAYNNLAFLNLDKGDLDAAARYFRASMDVQDEVLDADHPNRAHTLNGLATVYRRQGNPAAALPLLRRSLDLREAAYAPDHRYVLDSKGDLGACLLDLGRRDEARRLLQESYDGFLATRGPDDSRTQRAKERLERL